MEKVIVVSYHHKTIILLDFPSTGEIFPWPIHHKNYKGLSIIFPLSTIKRARHTFLKEKKNSINAYNVLPSISKRVHISVMITKEVGKSATAMICTTKNTMERGLMTTAMITIAITIASNYMIPSVYMSFIVIVVVFCCRVLFVIFARD